MFSRGDRIVRKFVDINAEFIKMAYLGITYTVLVHQIALKVLIYEADCVLHYPSWQEILPGIARAKKGKQKTPKELCTLHCPSLSIRIIENVSLYAHQIRTGRHLKHTPFML